MLLVPGVVTQEVHGVSIAGSVGGPSTLSGNLPKFPRAEGFAALMEYLD
jgi:hypothetical protein